MSWQDDVSELLRGHTDRDDEAQILAHLRAAPAAELDGFLCHDADVVALVHDVDDRLFGPDNQRAHLDLLRARLADLSVRARALLIGAAQRGRTSARDERFIADLFLATHGEDLAELKRNLDTGQDHRDLQQLIYSDVDDSDIQREILEHIALNAPKIARDVKLLSDIDDTLYANWKDKRYPKKTVYPGVRAFYASIADQVAFVTARPKDRPGIIEKKTHETLRELGVLNPVVLTGSFLKVFSNEMIAGKKRDNFVEYAALYPESSFVFVGDSGQGDARFGAQIKALEPERVRAIFIHDVTGTPEEERARFREEGVYFEDTYIGAAARAVELGLCDARAARAVRDAALEELDALELDDDLYRARKREHDADATRIGAAS